MKRLSIFLFLIALFLSNQCFSQSCSDLKSGTFYSYPKNSGEQWKIVREGSKEKYINLVTGDSLVWKIDWQNECQFKMKYMGGSGQLKKQDAELFKNHVLVLSVETNNENFYLANYYLDKKSKVPFLSDTVWKKERAASDKILFSEVAPNEIRRLKFKDTSRYALLYVYRSGKFVGSLAGFILKCEGVAMAKMSNRSAYVFKIWKEGKLHFIAQTINHQDRADIDFQFGHKYYLNCDIKLTLDNGGRPVLHVVDKDKGEDGFFSAQ
ncbi:MAG TPA: hypothetical protein VNT20_04125 [Flavisolibacter sp.]|jgi:hypothetical protein|nr:hypothetical protein [Flavisolibacter sp.]